MKPIISISNYYHTNNFNLLNMIFLNQYLQYLEKVEKNTVYQNIYAKAIISMC